MLMSILYSITLKSISWFNSSSPNQHREVVPDHFPNLFLLQMHTIIQVVHAGELRMENRTYIGRIMLKYPLAQIYFCPRAPFKPNRACTSHPDLHLVLTQPNWL
jgi:hypothetical protein